MKIFARAIFQDPQHGLGKQILNIAICETKGNVDAYNYFSMSSNFELTIRLRNAFNEANAREYFGMLA